MVEPKSILALVLHKDVSLVTFVPWVAAKYDIEVTPFVSYLAAVLTVFVGLLMISNYRYYSFKLKGTVPYIFFVFAVLVLGITAQRPHEVFLLTTIAYASSGPATWLYRRQFKERSDARN